MLVKGVPVRTGCNVICDITNATQIYGISTFPPNLKAVCYTKLLGNGENGWHPADDISKGISLDEMHHVHRVYFHNSTDNRSVMFQMMAWFRTGYKQWWSCLLTHICRQACSVMFEVLLLEYSGTLSTLSPLHPRSSGTHRWNLRVLDR